MNSSGVALANASPGIAVTSRTQASRCPACHATTGEAVWSARRSGAFTVRRCRRCRLTFTVPQLSLEAMRAFYDERYYGTHTRRFAAVIEQVVGWFRRRRAQAVCRMAPPGRVLDVGCGRGLILDALRARGWITTGMELSEAAAVHARDVLGLEVIVGPFSPGRFPDGHFDAVILWHVLEHLPEPGLVIRELARILRPGGVLALAVPNIESWQARVTGQAWFHLDLPRHYSHFSEPWLRAALAAAGVRVVAVSHCAFEHNLFGWIQSLLNCAGLPHNLLYDMLRVPSARTIRRPFRTHPVSALVSAVALGLLLVPAGALIAAEALARRGATIDLFARKECVA